MHITPRSTLITFKSNSIFNKNNLTPINFQSNLIIFTILCIFTRTALAQSTSQPELSANYDEQLIAHIQNPQLVKIFFVN